ncbi:MAG: redoxin domain-containing protein [Acidobacteria bacterium]|nr:redoxin domain-containing protein [Acidobacteriota bacterium]
MSEEPYNYDTFRRHMVKEDMHFPGGPEPGQLAPDFNLPTVDGGRFRLSDHRGKRPVLIQFGSVT